MTHTSSSIDLQYNGICYINLSHHYILMQFASRTAASSPQMTGI